MYRAGSENAERRRAVLFERLIVGARLATIRACNGTTFCLCSCYQKSCFGSMFSEIGNRNVGFEDFRDNGLLLPATEAATLKTGMPMHRGPHKLYNEMVIERVGRVEEHWSTARQDDAGAALVEALMRLHLLQNALRSRLLSERRRFLLNRKDPLGTGYDFGELDIMAEALWKAT